MAQAEQEHRELRAEQARLLGAIREHDEKLEKKSIAVSLSTENDESPKKLM